MTRLRCDGILNDQFITQSLLSPRVKKNLKIGQHLLKLWAIKYRVVFYETRYMFGQISYSAMQTVNLLCRNFYVYCLTCTYPYNARLCLSSRVYDRIQYSCIEFLIASPSRPGDGSDVVYDRRII